MNVFVVVMSAPASKYASWISAHDLGRGQVEEIGVALDVARVVAEALAAVLLLGEPAPVDEHAPGAVEHDDALGRGVVRQTGLLALISTSGIGRPACRAGPGEGAGAL